MKTFLKLAVMSMCVSVFTGCMPFFIEKIEHIERKVVKACDAEECECKCSVKKKKKATSRPSKAKKSTED
jgi:hypothetical protein